MVWILCHGTESLANGIQMELPPGWSLHFVFHIDKLKRYILSEGFLWEVQPPPPIVVKDHLEYEVKDLIFHQGKGAH